MLENNVIEKKQRLKGSNSCNLPYKSVELEATSVTTFTTITLAIIEPAETPQEGPSGPPPLLLDIGGYVGKNIFLIHRWRPDSTYQFPKVQQGKENRSFSLKWLDSFEWYGYN